MPRLIHPLFLTVLILVWPSGAWAQTGGTVGTGPGSLSSSDFSLFIESYDPGRKTWVQLSAVQEKYFFNRARCECVGDVTNYSGFVKVAIKPAPQTPQKIAALLAANAAATGVGRLYVGGSDYNCLDIGSTYSLSAYCTNLLDPGAYAASFPLTVFETQSLYESPPIPVAWLYNSLAIPVCSVNGTCGATSGCASTVGSAMLYFWAQTSSSQYPDNDDSAVALDLLGHVPYAPTDVTVAGGNEALVATWSWPAGTPDSDFLGVQLLCDRGPGEQVFKLGSYTQTFMTSASLCPNTTPATSATIAFGNLDPRYLCSGLLSPTTASYRIVGLQNGVPYGVGAVAVDNYGNVSELSNIAYGIPGTTSPASYYGDAGACELAAKSGRNHSFSNFGLLGLGVVVVLVRRRKPPFPARQFLIDFHGVAVAARARSYCGAPSTIHWRTRATSAALRQFAAAPPASESQAGSVAAPPSTPGTRTRGIRTPQLAGGLPGDG